VTWTGPALDAVNGGFELVGSLLVANHCRAVLRDRAVAGVSIVSTAAFTSWGLWNLLYYPALGQWLSFAGGCCMVAANAAWLSLLWAHRGGRRRR
jgi:hypothetical protein